MLSANFVLVIGLAYVALLFVIAFVSDRRARRGKQGLIQSPIVYTLSISVYCTSWTFYGAVGSAARNGLEFATIYLGPTLVFVGWWFVLRKLVRIGRLHRITSIADLISSRYGKSTSLGVLVTVIAVISTVPYIALQLQAVSTSFVALSSPDSIDGGVSATDAIYQTGLWVAIAMAIFTILFGTRNIDANERHHGVVAAIAFEALVKLFALIAVGLFVVISVGGVGALFSLEATNSVLKHNDAFGSRWFTLIFLSACAIICLPRQFQVTVVENSDERHLRTASWMFPLYLFLMSLFVLPIAIVGVSSMPPAANADMYVVTLPIFMGQETLALLAFIGGFSSATSMVIVATIALSIMVSNHIVMPSALRLPQFVRPQTGDVKNLLLTSRRISIVLILLFGFFYFRFTQPHALASIGLIAFTGVAQFLPPLLGGLFWRQATSRGAIAGLIAGFAVWMWCLFLPGLFVEGQITDIFQKGPWGISWLRSTSLFGLEGMDPLVHAVFWSLSFNVVFYILFSLLRDVHPLERLQGALFVDIFRRGDLTPRPQRSAAAEDLFLVAQRILGSEPSYRLFREAARRQGADGDMPVADAEFITSLERKLAGSIGAATAHAMISQVAIGDPISLEEVIRVVDETQQVIVYSQQLEKQSKEVRETAAQLQIANEQLKRLDKQKDDFLSQVSHEVRTPMTSIRSFTEILLDNPDLSAEDKSRYLKIVHSETLRLTGLLDEILDLGHLESGDVPWNMETVEVDATVQRAVDSCRGIAEARGVSLKASCEASGARANAVPDRLHQLFVNLLTNAVKYNTNADPAVEVRSFRENGHYCCDVRDNGPGIPAADRTRIFEKYSRGWDQSRSPMRGTGLGLSISKQIAEKMNGSLELLDIDGRGACFRLKLPLVADETRAKALSH